MIAPRLVLAGLGWTVLLSTLCIFGPSLMGRAISGATRAAPVIRHDPKYPEPHISFVWWTDAAVPR